jgi:hypothetical protein
MKYLLTSLIVLFSFGYLLAQDVTVTTVPAARKVGIQDPFEVQYVIRNARNAQSFSLPQMKDLQVLDGPSRSTQMIEVNGHRTMIVQLTYVFKARKTGQVVIPGGVVVSDGRELRSNNVTIEVINGSVMSRQSRRQQADPFGDEDPFADLFGDEDPFAAMQKHQQQMMQMMQRQMQQSPMAQRMQPQQRAQQQPAELISRNDIANNLFIKVNVDKRTVMLGEQITVSYKLYTRLPMEINLTKLPSLNGFWSQDFKLPQPPKPVKEIYNGKEFQVFEIKRTALFPTQTGTLELDAAEAEGIARILKPKRVRQENPFGDDPFSSSFFGSMMMNDPAFNDSYLTTYDYEDIPVKLKSMPVSITVNDIPVANRPSTYDGAVGNYTIESNIDKTELTTDDVATISFKITGTGNLKMIGTPVIRFPEDIDTYDPKVSDTITNTNDIIAGYKSFLYSFTPRIPGAFTIPSTDFTYFDPNLKEFKTLTTPSYTLHVKPGKNENQSAQNRLPKDIHDINATAIKIEKVSRSILPASPFYWGGFALPLLAYIGLIAYRKKEDELVSNTVLFKNKRANKIALKRLEQASNYLKSSSQSEFFEETSKAVWLYLSDKLTIPLSSLSKEVAAQKMKEKSISSELQSELFRITDECEMALYAPDRGTMKMHQTYSDAFKLIGKLEDELS